MKKITLNSSKKITLNKLILKIKSAKFNEKNHFSQIVGNNRFIVWGQGEAYNAFQRSVISVLKKKPDFVIDKKKIKKKNFLLKSKLYYWSKKKKNSFFYILCTGLSKNFRQIKSELLKMGIDRKKIIWVTKIYEFNIHTWQKKFENRREFIKQIPKIRKAYYLLSDADSKKIYLKLLDIYITHLVKKIPQTRQVQYFPKNLFKQEDYKNIINCGAYDGDTLEAYFQKYKLIAENGKMYEPDKKNFIKLVSKSNDIKKIRKLFNLDCLNYALSNKDGYLKFIINKGLSSEVAKTKNLGIKIKCSKLDTELKNIYIKNWYLILDCEGHEIKVLQGAKNNIENNNLNIAVSIYHKISDLWDIILLLNTYNIKFKFFIKNYSGFTYETVLYAKK